MRGIISAAIYFTALTVVCAAYSGAGEAADLATSPRTTSGVTEREQVAWAVESAGSLPRNSRPVTSAGAALHQLGRKHHEPSTRQVIRSVFGRYGSQALRVARCESGLRPRAVSSTGDAGLFQANFSAHHRRGESFTEFKRRMFDVPYHVRWAYRLSRGGTNWSAWRWSQRCWG